MIEALVALQKGTMLALAGVLMWFCTLIVKSLVNTRERDRERDGQEKELKKHREKWKNKNLGY